jgi:hypothetical protein
MSDAPEQPHGPPVPHRPEYEDPHYHDDDELPGYDEQQPGSRPSKPRKPGRRIPPPRRRHYED